MHNCSITLSSWWFLGRFVCIKNELRHSQQCCVIFVVEILAIKVLFQGSFCKHANVHQALHAISKLVDWWFKDTIISKPFVILNLFGFNYTNLFGPKSLSRALNIFYFPLCWEWRIMEKCFCESTCRPSFTYPINLLIIWMWDIEIGNEGYRYM